MSSISLEGGRAPPVHRSWSAQASVTTCLVVRARVQSAAEPAPPGTLAGTSLVICTSYRQPRRSSSSV